MKETVQNPPKRYPWYSSASQPCGSILDLQEYRITIPRRHKSHRLVSFPRRHSTLLYMKPFEIALSLAFFEITTSHRHVALRVANIRVTTWTWIKHIGLRSLRPHLRLAIHSRCHQCGIHARRPQLGTWIKACVLYVRIPSILEEISSQLCY